MVRARAIPLLTAALLAWSGPGYAQNRAAGPTLSAASLPQLLEQGTAAFARGDFAAAADAFLALERDFGAEPPWADGTLPRKVLPLRGYASLRAGRAEAASRSLEEFLARYPDERGSRSFALYAAALAHAAAGRPAAAEKRFAEFTTEFAGTAQAALAQGQRAELLFQLGRPGEGFAALEAVAADAPSPALRTQARLRALQRALETDESRVRPLLLGRPWSVDTMPEIGQLAFAALSAGDRWLAAGRAEDALAAFRLVLPKERLVHAQRRRLEELKRVFAERAPAAAAGPGAVWVEFYRGLIGRVEAQLAGLEAAEDYTPALRFRQGQAHLLAGRPREAWLLFEGLAVAPATEPGLRAESHYRWILAAMALQRWEDALALARSFVGRFPASELAPAAFYLIAQAHLEQHRHREAIEVLTDLLARFPAHELRPRLLFTRGYARAVLQENAAARDDFAACAGEFPASPLAARARLWHALTRHFERDYAGALAELDAMLSAERGRPLEGEIRYRRAAALHALRRADEAVAAATEFLARFPRHEREHEARVLRGDALLGLGRLEEARRDFDAVPADAGPLFIYAAFQAGKALRALGDPEAVAAHFTAYAARNDLPAGARVGEALYWVGWARTRQERPAEAFPVFLEALARHGNDLQSGELQPVLAALERLHRQARGLDALPADSPLRAARTFADWVAAEREAARSAGRYTQFARLAVWLADHHERGGRPHLAEAALLEVAGTAPLEALDPTALGRVGRALQAIGAPSARDCFERLLSRFPASPERAFALVGLAEFDLAEGARERALARLERVAAETPLHPLAPRAALLAAQTLRALGRPEAAAARFEELLRQKSARGRPHAEALAGLAALAEERGDSAAAIAYHQRVYTLHRAQPDLVATAYATSARLFEARGDLRAALRTYDEYLGQPALAGTAPFAEAERERERLRPLVPPEPTPTGGVPAP